jgi:hypothetical protein
LSARLTFVRLTAKRSAMACMLVGGRAIGLGLGRSRSASPKKILRRSLLSFVT